VVLDLVDEFLWVFHPYAYGKGLCFQQPASVGEKAIDVTCGMAGGKNDGRGMVFVSLLVCYADNLGVCTIALGEEVDNVGGEVVFSPVLLNGVAHVGNDAAQSVCTDVGMCIDGNCWVGPVFDETVQHLLYVASFVATGV
jgi:hypothetical protein